MSAFEDIAAYTQGVIEGIDDFNKVYLTTRIIENEEDLLADFGVTGEVGDEELPRTHGWMVSLKGREPELFETGVALVTYPVEAICMSSVYDRGASEVAFRAHIMAVVEAMEADSCPAAIANCYDVGPVTTEIELVEWPPLDGRRLHHRAVCRWAVRTEESVGS